MKQTNNQPIWQIGYQQFRQLLKRWKVITHNLQLVQSALKKAGAGLDAGARGARDEMAMVLTQLAKEEIAGKRGKTNGVWDKATSGQPPMNRTGNLRRSIRAEKKTEGFAKYSALVGPTIVYGRAVELGGAPTWEPGTKFPYMAPAFAKFRVVAPFIIRKHLAIGGK